MRTKGYVRCTKCEGRKALGERCLTCDGTGTVAPKQGLGGTTCCPLCRGRGYSGPVCPDCYGRGEIFMARLEPAESMAGICLEQRGPGLYAVPEGWKACPARHRSWRVRDVGGAVCCPGCDRLCKVPGAKPGDQVKIMKRV